MSNFRFFLISQAQITLLKVTLLFYVVANVCSIDATLMQKLSAFFFLLFILMPFKQALAFGGLGHQLICQLAYEQLPATQQQKLDNLLQQLNNKDKQAIAEFVKNKSPNSLTFAQSCTWADAIKKRSEYNRYKSWHYINVTRDTKDIHQNSCTQDCITKGIAYHRKQLQQLTNTQQKIKALMFLSHWLGDIHQPLHVSFASDLGGNKTKVSSIDDQCTSMHWLWDNCLLTRQVNADSFSKTYQLLYKKLSQQLAGSPINSWLTQSNNHPELVWANETFELTTMPTLQYCQQTATGCVAYKGKIKLAENYQQKFAPIINQQVLKASVRLAQELKQAL